MADAPATRRQVPIVAYLVLDDPPYLDAGICEGCGARYLERRAVCSRCGRRGTFSRKPLSREGRVRSFTVVARGAPGVPAPFVSVVVDLDGGGAVKANLLGVEPVAEAVRTDQPVTLDTFVAGIDDDGLEAVAFGFRPTGDSR